MSRRVCSSQLQKLSLKITPNLSLIPNLNPRCLLNRIPELIRVCRRWGRSGEEEVEKEDAEERERERALFVFAHFVRKGHVCQ